MRRSPLRPLLAAVLAVLGGLANVAASGGFVDRFETAWRLVDERYWDLQQAAVDWDEARVRYGALVQEVSSNDGLYTLLEAMFEEIGDDHTVFVRPERVAEFRERYGDLPCIGVFGLTPPAAMAVEPAPDALSFAGPVGYALLPDGTGYLRLADLVASGAAPGVRSAVEELLRLGADAFVLDLRGNPGGRLVTMMQVAGVFTGGFLWRAVTTWSLPIPYPAIGVTTAGNVEAVLPFCLRDGSQAWVATGVLAPIGGPTWEGRGVEPDIPVDPQEALATALEALRKAR